MFIMLDTGLFNDSTISRSTRKNQPGKGSNGATRDPRTNWGVPLAFAPKRETRKRNLEP